MLEAELGSGLKSAVGEVKLLALPVELIKDKLVLVNKQHTLLLLTKNKVSWYKFQLYKIFPPFFSNNNFRLMTIVPLDPYLINKAITTSC